MNRFVVCGILLLGLFMPTPEGWAQEPVVVAVRVEQLEQILQDRDAPLTVVNLWATWCAPCIEEFPYFVRLGKDLADQGVEVFFVSMDFEDEVPVVKAFLAEQGYYGTSYLRSGEDHVFITGLHEGWSGAIPATFLYSRDGSLTDFWQGTPVDYEALKKRVLDALYSKPDQG